MKNILFITFLFAILVFSTAKAQVKVAFIAAKIYLNNGQTLDGFVKDDEIGKMNYKVFYKQNLTDKTPKTYDTTRVKKVILANGETYQSLKIKPHYNTDSIQVLGKQILSGNTSLYEIYYSNDNVLIVENNGITNCLQEDKLENANYIVTKYFFKDYLANALNAKDALLTMIYAMQFSKNKIIKLITDFNASNNNKTTKLKTKLMPVSFIYVDAGGNNLKAYDKEFFMQLSARVYYPKLSKSTSLSLGVSYYNANFFSQNYGSNLRIKYNQKLFSIPLQLQQNILNKNIRPYVFVGINFSHIKVKEVTSLANPFESGFQANYGFAGLYGAGIEIDFLPRARFKCEFRNENYIHVILFGLGLYLKK